MNHFKCIILKFLLMHTYKSFLELPLATTVIPLAYHWLRSAAIDYCIKQLLKSLHNIHKTVPYII